jgi:P27 family predicted phage terminase small subunit
MANPNPKPTAIKLAEGNASKQKLSAKEPKGGAFKQLTPPAYLPDEAKPVWAEIVSEFMALDLLQSVDTAKLTIYCRDVAVVRRLMQELSTEGDTFQGISKAGMAYQQLNAKATLFHQCFTRIQKLGAEFGDSPSARARLGRLMDDDKDELDGFLDEKPA